MQVCVCVCINEIARERVCAPELKQMRECESVGQGVRKGWTREMETNAVVKNVQSHYCCRHNSSPSNL